MERVVIMMMNGVGGSFGRRSKDGRGKMDDGD